MIDKDAFKISILCYNLLLKLESFYLNVINRKMTTGMNASVV